MVNYLKSWSGRALRKSFAVVFASQNVQRTSFVPFILRSCLFLFSFRLLHYPPIAKKVHKALGAKERQKNLCEGLAKTM